MKRIINLPPRGIGKQSIEQIELEAANKHTSMMEILTSYKDSRSSKKLQFFLDLLKDVKSFLGKNFENTTRIA